MIAGTMHFYYVAASGHQFSFTWGHGHPLGDDALAVHERIFQHFADGHINSHEMLDMQSIVFKTTALAGIKRAAAGLAF